MSIHNIISQHLFSVNAAFRVSNQLHRQKRLVFASLKKPFVKHSVSESNAAVVGIGDENGRAKLFFKVV